GYAACFILPIHNFRPYLRAYVTKPFDALRLAERLADILNGPAELAAAI
ncbi:hypothetical protein HN371_02415, partial [Candidatus Poribacteria bacterium]|nr:hypothetical protein [Candidatus Poribacteria bacterium]